MINIKELNIYSDEQRYPGSGNRYQIPDSGIAEEKK
jgi:hypothetical protein